MTTATLTVEEIVEAERKQREAWEASETYKGFTIAELRKVMDKVQDKAHWKNPWAASVPHQIVGAVLAAVEFFHADQAELVGIEPITGHVLMRGKGYQAW